MNKLFTFVVVFFLGMMAFGAYSIHIKDMRQLDAAEVRAKGLEWENVGRSTWRQKLPEGWLVKTTTMDGVAMVYVVDKDHKWEIKK